MTPLSLEVNYLRSERSAPTVQNIDWQNKAVDDILTKLYGRDTNYRGIILRGGTGVGKMYMTAKAIKTALDLKMIKPVAGSINPLPVLWLLPKSLKMQTQRCLKEYGIAHMVMVMTYGEIKSGTGMSMFIQYITTAGPHGPEIEAAWYPHMTPALVVCDEIQKLKNKSARVSNVVHNLPETVKWIGMSATPWQRVADCGVHLVRLGAICPGHNALPATEHTAPAILRSIADPAHPDDYNASSVKRLRDALDSYIVELKNVKFKFPTKTSCISIPFRTEEAKAAYQRAYDDYIREMWELKKVRKQHWGVIKMWVAMQKFQQKAEFLRCDEMAERCLIRIKEGKQVIIASNYIETLRQVWRILEKVHNHDMTKVAFIVGKQTELQRQQEIDDFQTGRADIILFTMRSGGVGISLHHDRKETKPRHIILPPTWSAIDLVQALGRGHRLTSLSPTTQEILWYKGTVEDRVKVVVEKKTRCIAKSVTAKEQFITLFDKAAEEDMEVKEEESNELNDALEVEKHTNENGEGDIDAADEGEDAISGEGLDSDDTLPTSYK